MPAVEREECEERGVLTPGTTNGDCGASARLKHDEAERGVWAREGGSPRTLARELDDVREDARLSGRAGGTRLPFLGSCAAPVAVATFVVVAIPGVGGGEKRGRTTGSGERGSVGMENRCAEGVSS